MRYRITWSDNAYIDLNEIRAYLEAFSLQTANRILDRITVQANSLVDFPYRCKKTSENSDKRRLVIDG